jgi:hypothetical protein
MSIYGRVKRWRARRQAEVAEQYANLSAEERAELDRLREEHDPLGELAQARSGSAWGRMVEDELKPPRR